MFGKIVNGKFVSPPVNSGNRLNVHKDPQWLAAHGYHELTAEEITAIKPSAPVRKYSKLKIIETLGENWNAWKAKIEAAGLLDYWNNCQYLASDYPAFKQFYRQLSPEERKLLNTRCRWENN